MRSTVQFSRDLTFLVQLKHMKYTRVCIDLQFLVQLKSVKYTAVLLGFAILGTVKICKVHWSFVGIYNSWYS